MNTNKQRLFLVLVYLLPCAALADEFSGVWSGAVSQGGNSYALAVTFSQDGYPIFSYTNNKNLTRERELRAPGEKVEYVPKGGGVQTYVLEEIAKDAGHLVYAMRSSFQRASNGYLTQNFHRYIVEYVLDGAQLHVTVVDQANGYMGDHEMSVIDAANQSVAKGVLRRAQ